MLPAMVPGCWKWAPALPKVAILLRRRAEPAVSSWMAQPAMPASAAVFPKGWRGPWGQLKPQLPAVMVGQAGTWHSQAGQPWCLAVTLSCLPQLLLQPTR